MYLTAFLHREDLFEITNRWLSDRLKPEDPLKVTRIISYDSFVAWETIQHFIIRLLPLVYENSVHHRTISSKKELKDFLCCSPPPMTDRIRRLLRDYQKRPEYYYYGSPLAAVIYHDDGDRLMGMCRLKRVNRTAEKASRYASLHIYREILEEDPSFAELDEVGNFHRQKIHLKKLIQAEKKVMERIRRKGISLPVEVMTIKDVIGMKIVDTGFGEAPLEKAIASLPGAVMVEKEKHTGNYNAVHYVVEIKVDFEHLIKRFAEGCRYDYLMKRGLPENQIEEDFSGFVRSGSDTIQIDLIFTTYSELIESEIGRSMHETRIFEQRQQQGVYGNVPKNIEYIIEFMIAVGLSPTVQLDEIPIKIWGRYLPDTLSYRVRRLYNLPEYALIDFINGMNGKP